VVEVGHQVLDLATIEPPQLGLAFGPAAGSGNFQAAVAAASPVRRVVPVLIARVIGWGGLVPVAQLCAGTLGHRRRDLDRGRHARRAAQPRDGGTPGIAVSLTDIDDMRSAGVRPYDPSAASSSP
jgi:hypothetical protein